MYFLVLSKFNFMYFLWLKLSKVLLYLDSLLNLITAHFLKIQNSDTLYFLRKSRWQILKVHPKKKQRIQNLSKRKRHGIIFSVFLQDKIPLFHHLGGCEQFLLYLHCIFPHWILIFQQSTMACLRVRYRYLRVLYRDYSRGMLWWLIRSPREREYTSSRRVCLTFGGSCRRERGVRIGVLT